MPTATFTRIDLFTVPRGAVPRAVARMATDRWRLRRAEPVFWKLLGTGDGRTFDARDADLRRWAVLTVWDDLQRARGFGTTAAATVTDGWTRLADEHWWTLLQTTRSTGSWSGAQPFVRAPSGVPRAGRAPTEPPHAGPVAAVTRARLRWSRAARFWRSVAPVNADLDQVAGLRLRIGIGEAPVGLQGTFTLWDSARSLQEFAYRRDPHREVIARSAAERWYVEELFARFAVLDHGGTVFGDDPLA